MGTNGAEKKGLAVSKNSPNFHVLAAREPSFEWLVNAIVKIQGLAYHATSPELATDESGRVNIASQNRLAAVRIRSYRDTESSGYFRVFAK